MHHAVLDFFTYKIMGLKSTFLSCSWKYRRRRWKSFSRLYHTQSETPQGSSPLPTFYKGIESTNMRMTSFVKNGQLDQARMLFDEMSDRTVVSWNIMVSGYSKWRQFNEALSLLSLMHRSKVRMNDVTCSSALRVCAGARLYSGGCQIHCLVLKSDFENFESVGSSLLYFYASFYRVGDARKVFDELHEKNGLLWSIMLTGYVQCNFMNDALSFFNKMPSRGVVEWTTLISGYSKSNEGVEMALELFRRMRMSGEAVPNEFTLDSVIRACGRPGAFQAGKAIHSLLIRLGYGYELSRSGALVDFYCGNGAIDEAKQIYDTLDTPCLDISNNLIGALITLGRFEEAEFIFCGLVDRNPVSYSLMIKGYALHGRLEDSKTLFLRMPDSSLICMNTMIHVLSRSGEVHNAVQLFEQIKAEGSPATWNSMISGYIENDQHEIAIKLYIDMCRLSISRSRSTFSALLRACSSLGSITQGQQVHGHLIKTPLESSVYVGTGLVDMYSKCGSIIDAQTSFTSIACPNVAAWTSLISGFAHHGIGSETILLFQQMLCQGVNPNAATFTAVLSACNGAGMVREGMKIFRLMKQPYGIIPTLEHFTCMIDLLCRSGLLVEAEELMKEMPFEADEILLITLLNSCWSWMGINLGEQVAQKMFTLNPKPVSTCVLISNIYAALGKWGEKIKAHKLLVEMEAKKDPGCSWIYLCSQIHTFHVDDRTHPHSDMIYSTLGQLTAKCSEVSLFKLRVGKRKFSIYVANCVGGLYSVVEAELRFTYKLGYSQMGWNIENLSVNNMWMPVCNRSASPMGDLNLKGSNIWSYSLGTRVCSSYLYA